MKPQIKTTEDLANFLASIGKPGKKQDEKVAAVKALNLSNIQGHGLHLILENYKEF